jgi:hypothetical protein
MTLNLHSNSGLVILSIASLMDIKEKGPIYKNHIKTIPTDRENRL